MTKKIFQSILLVAGCVLLASLLIIMGFLYDYFGGVEENQLRDELSLAAAAVEDGGTDYLSQLTADRCRLTWIAADGSVLYDTRTDAESLENHASRAEVSQALATGIGESTRYSSTLMEKTMYYAQRLDDGTVLRISISRATVGMIAVGMIQPLLIVLIVALILSGLLARRLSRRIVTRSTASISSTRLTTMPTRSSLRCSSASTASTSRSRRSCASCAKRPTSSRRSPAACARALSCSTSTAAS